MEESKHVDGWVSRQAWTPEAVCPELEINWPDFKRAVQAERPPSLPTRMRRERLGFRPGLTMQGPGQRV